MSTKRVQSKHTALTISVDELSLGQNAFRNGLADVGPGWPARRAQKSRIARGAFSRFILRI
ncbi:MAG: hypothetical protein CMJ77_09580 [Planctomycetaceae bacterium]|nr:hypothetical protein [Planctomycetaceae bacterium]